MMVDKTEVETHDDVWEDKMMGVLVQIRSSSKISMKTDNQVTEDSVSTKYEYISNHL